MGAVELKIAMLTWGRTTMLRECTASGDETQKNSAYSECAK